MIIMMLLNAFIFQIKALFSRVLYFGAIIFTLYLFLNQLEKPTMSHGRPRLTFRKHLSRHH